MLNVNYKEPTFGLPIADARLGRVLANGFLEALAGAEAGHSHLRDVNFGAGLRVDAAAGGALAEVEGPETGDGHLLALGDSALDDIDQSRQGLLNLALGCVGLYGQSFN